MRNRLARVIAIVALGVLVVAPLMAASYVITLKNGTTFSTRYKPQEAPWDANKVLFLTEWGNQIALAKDDLDTVVSEFEKGGFGHVINNTTVELGIAPNDAEVPGQQDTSPAGQLRQVQQMLQQQQQPAPNYTMQQFTEPSSTTGIPLNYIGAGNQTPPLGGVINMTTPPSPPGP